MIRGEPIDPCKVAAAMLEALWKLDIRLLCAREEILKQYRANCITVGQDISLIRADEIRYGKALDIDENGALVVIFDNGSIETVNSGEVSVRGMYGYV